MAKQTFDVPQNIFQLSYPPIHVVSVNEDDLTADPQLIMDFISTAEDDGIGLAPVYGAKCALTILAFSTLSQVLLVRFASAKTKGKKKKKKSHSTPGQCLLRDNILCHPERQKFAFHMDRLSASLFLDLNLRITGGVDLLSSSRSARQSIEAKMNALGGETTLHKTHVITLFKHNETVTTPAKDLALQAWAACQAGSLPSLINILSRIPRINTRNMGAKQLHFLATTLRDADRLESLKPTKVKNDVTGEFSIKDRSLHINSSRYNTRIMKSSSQTIEVVMTAKGKKNTAKGRVMHVEGRAAKIALRDNLRTGKIHSVHTIGKEDPNSAETWRARIILDALQQTISIVRQPFVQSIWFPSETPTWPVRQQLAHPSLNFIQRPLNLSQALAVKNILSDSEADRISVIHGPPGTGKTTVIAASVISTMTTTARRTMWLIAQSNYAVRNIAEKLAEFDFLNFKLLVSKGFHFDWHEHLYEKIHANVIDSSMFPDDNVSANRLLLGCRVILCTLSMLSNNKLAIFSRLVPIEFVVVDEASQIEIGDYLPMLSRSESTLRKLVFIGDNKQLAPYRQDDIGDLRSIFEILHLRDRAIFLDTQYRMPEPIGNFISQYVYNGRLKTRHEVTSLSSCRLLDVWQGKEQSTGSSWVNVKEVQAVISIACMYNRAGKVYRIITPYDGQRNMLEKQLKAAKLPWEDKCFNVDAFQGNEEDHIIISLVRSDKVGFLKNIRRTNVMLSRCKRSMMICTSRAFLHGIAASSLVGTLATVLGEQAWQKWP